MRARGRVAARPATVWRRARRRIRRGDRRARAARARRRRRARRSDGRPLEAWWSEGGAAWTTRWMRVGGSAAPLHRRRLDCTGSTASGEARAARDDRSWSGALRKASRSSAACRRQEVLLQRAGRGHRERRVHALPVEPWPQRDRTDLPPVARRAHLLRVVQHWEIRGVHVVLLARIDEARPNGIAPVPDGPSGVACALTRRPCFADAQCRRPRLCRRPRPRRHSSETLNRAPPTA